MHINSWPGAIAVILAIVSFYGMTYVVIALNVGWRFGYWLSASCFGVLMVLLSLFWVLNVRTDQAVGPQGALPSWIPLAVGDDIQQVEFKGEPITAPSAYPGGAWVKPEEGDPHTDTFGSAISNCLSANPEKLPELEKVVCGEAQKLMPDPKTIPVINGTPVVVTPQLTDFRTADDHGVLGAAIVRPITIDPRVSKDPDGKLMGDPFMIVAILDKGSVGLPSYMSFVIFVLFAAFHLWGLNRAERRHLSPAVT